MFGVDKHGRGCHDVSSPAPPSRSAGAEGCGRWRQSRPLLGVQAWKESVLRGNVDGKACPPPPISQLTSVLDQSALRRPRFSEGLHHLLVFNCVFQAAGSLICILFTVRLKRCPSLTVSVVNFMAHSLRFHTFQASIFRVNLLLLLPTKH